MQEWSADQLEREVREGPPGRIQEDANLVMSAHGGRPRTVVVDDVSGHERQDTLGLVGVPRLAPAESEVLDEGLIDGPLDGFGRRHW
jgi:hypothetical protein